MNATCVLYGHDWFWRHAIRQWMCRRCLRFQPDDEIPETEKRLLYGDR